MFRQLPHQRKLTPHEQEEAKRLLELKANKKMVKDNLVQSTGKAILLKDLSNLMTKVKSSRSRNDLEATVKKLTDKFGEYSYRCLFPFHDPNRCVCDLINLLVYLNL